MSALLTALFLLKQFGAHTHTPLTHFTLVCLIVTYLNLAFVSFVYLAASLANKDFKEGKAPSR